MSREDRPDGPPRENAGFRSTFLSRFTPRDRACLERLAEMLDEYAAMIQAETETTPTHQEYDGMVADARYLAEVCDWIASEPQRTQLDDDDLERSNKARRLAGIFREALHHV